MNKPLTQSEIAALVGARIRELRLEAEMSQRELANRAYTDRALVGRAERGRHCLKLEQINSYAKALGVETMLILIVLDDDWREQSGWSPEYVRRWWPKGRLTTMGLCRPGGEPMPSGASAPTT